MKPDGKRVAVLGAGSWGAVLAKLLSDSSCRVNLWARSAEFIENLKLKAKFERPIEFSLQNNIQLTSSLEEAIKGVELVVCSIPSEGVPSLISQVKQQNLQLPQFLLSTSKGLSAQGQVMSDLWEEAFPSVTVTALSGPNLSAEAVVGLPMKTIIAARNLKDANTVANFFDCKHLKVGTSDDLLGIELAGVAKNVIALAAGAWDGLELGISGKSAMLTRAVDELASLVELLGGSKASAYSVAGIGDLFLTCSSNLSRNYRAGWLAAKGKSLEEIKTELKGQVAEGIWTTPLVHTLLAKYNGSFAVCDATYKMLNMLPLNQNKQEDLKNMFFDLI